MLLRRVAVLGGGPGGLYAARLLKLAHPDCEVVVHEQGVPDATFGFGVGLAARTQRNLEAADPDSLRDIVASGLTHDMEMVVRGRTCRVDNGALVGVARTRLLAVLQQYAEKAGVRLEFGRRVDAADLDADLVIAADGVNSATRTARAADFGATVVQGEGLYLWAATDVALDRALFEPVETEHGTFVTHAYPYQDDRSTFLIETDEVTWRRAGLDVAAAGLPPEVSDEVSLRHLERVFSRALDGHPLIGNRSQWLRFRTVRAERWSLGSTVLLGDAAHTAHYSIGSGTKLAMEDAIELVAALADADDVPTALAGYEQRRRPAVERLQALAHRSQLWWESFAGRLDTDVDRLMISYMSRAGNVPLDRFAASNPDVLRRALVAWCGQDPLAAAPGAWPADLDGWVLDRPYAHSRAAFPCRRVQAGAAARELGPLHQVRQPPDGPWSSAADRLVAAATGSAQPTWVCGPADRDDVLDRLDLAERLRSATGATAGCSVPQQYRADAAAALVSGRVDLVDIVDAVPAQDGGEDQ